MQYQPRTEGVFFGAVIVASFAKELFLSAPDWIGRDEAITPEPGKRCNWTMVGETLVPDRARRSQCSVVDKPQNIVKSHPKVPDPAQWEMAKVRDT
jgi:hypothetical protein